jgi:RTX calcium-binding nonapeptide repeat (4 copies)/Calx-beta domain/Cysteine-rich secretory protein family
MAIATEREQLSLELINRARLDPLGEAARYGIVDINKDYSTPVKADLPPGTIDTAPNQVLAFNSQLNDSADAHSQWMIDQDIFSHTGVGGSTSKQRMEAAGYVFGTSGWASGENLAATMSSGALNGDVDILLHHRLLMLSAGHRKNIMADQYREIGVGSITGKYGANNALLTTHNFAAAGDKFFVTGVTYNDAVNNDDFYSIGEGIAGRNVQLTVGTDAAISMVSQTAGGFALGTATAGQATIAFSGAGLTSTMGATFNLNGANVKIDMVDNNTVLSSVSAALTANTPNLTLIGVADVGSTGNELGNILTGNKGNNSFDGNGGDDTIRGGAGSDTAIYDGAFADYVFNYSAVTGVLTIVGAAEGADNVKDVEFFQFSDGVKTLAQAIAGATPTPTVSIAGSSAAVVEGNAGTQVLTFTVSLNMALGASQSVQYTVAGFGVNAANAADFEGSVSGSVVFAAGETSKTITVNVVGDTVSEAHETFNITLSNPTGAVVIGTASAAMTITNDDVPPSTINGTKKANVLNGTDGQNIINGLAGNDTITGFGANDTIDGGTGADTAVYRGASGDYTSTYDAVTGKFTISGGSDGVDTVSNVESFRFSDGTLSSNQMRGLAQDISGTKKANVLNGSIGKDNINGLGGNDTLNAGVGDDRLNGGVGNDVLTGGDGADTFLFTDATFGLDRITDFTEADQLQFALSLADNFTDFVITGNDTASVTLTLGANSVVVQGVGPIHIDADDFLFG